MEGSRVEKVMELHERKHNCSQSIFLAYYDLFDTGMDKKTALKLAMPFGGGLGRTQGVCGAVTGAAMILGLKYGEDVIGNKDPNASWEFHAKLREFMDEFKEINGSTYCSNIVKCNIKTPENYAKAKGNMDIYCTKAIRSAAELLEKRL